MSLDNQIKPFESVLARDLTSQQGVGANIYIANSDDLRVANKNWNVAVKHLSTTNFLEIRWANDQNELDKFNIVRRSINPDDTSQELSPHTFPTASTVSIASFPQIEDIRKEVIELKDDIDDLPEHADVSTAVRRAIQDDIDAGTNVTKTNTATGIELSSQDTTYTASIDGTTITLTDSDGGTQTIELPADADIEEVKRYLSTFSENDPDQAHFGTADIDGTVSGLQPSTTTITIASGDSQKQVVPFRFVSELPSKIPDFITYDESNGQIVLPRGTWILCGSARIANTTSGGANNNNRISASISIQHRRADLGYNTRHSNEGYVRWTSTDSGATDLASSVTDGFIKTHLSTTGVVVSDGVQPIRLAAEIEAQAPNGTVELEAGHMHAVKIQAIGPKGDDGEDGRQTASVRTRSGSTQATRGQSKTS